MDSKHLRALVTILDLNGFTRAARRLGLSQSAISQQIRALEDSAGAKLLLRSGSGIRPTPAGEVLAQYARQILAKMDEAKRMLSDFDHTRGGVLRVGAGGAGCDHLLPPVVKHFVEDFPEYGLQVSSGNSHLTMDRLLDGDLDAGLIITPAPEQRLKVFDLGSDELVAVVANDHPWAAQRRVELAEFSNERWLAYRNGSDCFESTQTAMLNAGVMPRMTMELDRPRAVMEMVRIGVGVSVLPRWSVADAVGRGELKALSIGKAGLYRRWALATRAEQAQSPALRAFVQLGLDLLPPLLTI